MEIGKLQYITNYQSQRSHVEQVKQVIDGGCTWIQYRPKYVSNETILQEGKQIAELCKQNKVTFIMNDRVDIAQQLNADGVHLGKNDMLPSEARSILGTGKIIGGTANTTKDIEQLVNQGVNYVGLGPFRFTTTKKNLSPTLGIDGYKSIIKQLKNKGIQIPIVAIGGIDECDIFDILNTGVCGLAVSSLISEANLIGDQTNKILKQVSNLTKV